MKYYRFKNFQTVSFLKQIGSKQNDRHDQPSTFCFILYFDTQSATKIIDTFMVAVMLQKRNVIFYEIYLHSIKNI